MADEFVPLYGIVEQVSPLVRRVLAHNPSPFSYYGTGTYIIGHKTVAVIDPGPDDSTHIDAILNATAGETISHIAITHTHIDHSPAAIALQAASGAIVTGCAPLVLEDDGPRADAGFDRTYAPDAVMADGDRIVGPGWTLEAVATPGHTSNHLCFSLNEEKILFSGDHVMGWSTTVVSPPDGDMADYMRSLEKLMDRDDEIYFPTHGGAIHNPRRFVRGLLTHRRQREQQIISLLRERTRQVPSLVERMYFGLDPSLVAAAGRSVLAHLIDMNARGLVREDKENWMLVE